MIAIMDQFESLAYLPSPVAYTGNGNQNLDYMSVASGVDPLEQYSNFDSDPYMSGDEMSYHQSGPLSQQILKRYPPHFEDPFAETTMTHYEQQTPGESPEDSSIDHDSRYLGFSMPHFPYALLNESFQRCSINVNAQLHGMFFLAESQWPTSADTAAPPPELTCYRRNLFQITGSVTLPRSLRYIFTEEGSRIPIYELELQVSASESVEGNPVKIISVPWKTPTGGEASKPEDKLEREPPTIALDKMAGADLDSDYTTFPFQWKRLQFRIATANNGRRKELQQHFTLHLKIMASLSTGGKFPIAEVHSGAVIVRGRSPRNFASRKDMPLSSSSVSRKHIPSISRASLSQTSVPQITSAPKIKSSVEGSPKKMSLDDSTLPAGGPDIQSWQQQQMASFADPVPTPGFLPLNPNFVTTFGQPSPDPNASSNFAFSPLGVPATDGALSLHFASDDEGGSPLPHDNPRGISRPPTSNPSPLLMNKRNSATMANISPGGASNSSKRPRLNSHPMPSKNGTAPTSMPPSLGMSTSAPSYRNDYHDMSTNKAQLQRTMSVPFSPVNEGADRLYEYFPLTAEDWQPPVDAVFRPHVVHHSVQPYPNPHSPDLQRNSKRYFSEVA